MNKLIIDAASNKIFLGLILNKNIYTNSYENSKTNFEKLIILINNLLKENKILMANINEIYVNRGPGSFAGIRNSLSIVKGIHLSQNIDFFCYSLHDFKDFDKIEYEDIPKLCDKNRIKKNLINPLYLG
jgi:tRNA A37 threonylcarbamoyladenosine modification protein TsaB